MLNINDTEGVFETDAERMAYQAVAEIDKIRVGHAFFDGAMRAIGDCVKASAYAREPANCMLLGEGGTGKTSVAKMLIQAMKPEIIRENDMEIRTVPAFYTSFRSASNLDALTADMLRNLGDPNPTSGKVDDKASRVLELLNRCRTKIIFIDELHDLDGFERRNYGAMHKLLKWIKAITNGCGPITCLMGIPGCHDLFEHDPEMARRFKRKLFLMPLMPGTKAEPGPLQGFLRDINGEVIRATPIRSFPPASYLFALQVYAATGGNQDFVMTLTKEVVLLAMLDNRTSVVIGDFARVWENGVLNDSSLVRINPFLSSHAQLAAAIREKQR